MNCPKCKEMVGNDQWARGPLRQEMDPLGVITDEWFELIVGCEFCGPTRVIVGVDNRIRAVLGPFKGSRARRLLLSQLPNPNAVEAA